MGAPHDLTATRQAQGREAATMYARRDLDGGALSAQRALRASVAPRLLTAQELAAYLNLPLTEVRRLNVGVLRFGARLRYDRVAVDRYFDRLADVQPRSTRAEADDEAEAALARFCAL